MPRTGFADLPLHGGRAPRWLFERMVRLSGDILAFMVEEMGPRATLERFADPFWFQALGCVLGFDWHSSGVTTTTCGAVKEALRHRSDLGIFAAGGKGASSRRTPSEIEEKGERADQAPSSLVLAGGEVGGRTLWQHFRPVIWRREAVARRDCGPHIDRRMPRQAPGRETGAVRPSQVAGF